MSRLLLFDTVLYWLHKLRIHGRYDYHYLTDCFYAKTGLPKLQLDRLIR